MADDKATGSRPEDADDLTAARDRLIVAMLPHVPFDGWGQTALARAAAGCGLDAAAARRIFPGDGMDMIAWHNDMADRWMLADLAALNPEGLKIRERIAAAIRVRLLRAAPHREAVRRGLTLMALPVHAPRALPMLYRTTDVIWRAAGDTATDWNHYSKRLLLGGVYMSTLTFWLDDSSEDFTESRAFLDRRIADALKIPALAGRLTEPVTGITRRIRALRAWGRLRPSPR